MSFKYSNMSYDKFYSSKHCQKENDEIKKVLESVCKDGSSVLDLGAGTGLVSSMLGGSRRITQVEKDSGMQKQNKYPNFIVADALDFMNSSEDQYDNVVSIFAMNYMKAGTLTKAAEIADNATVAVVYDKPYEDGSASYYRGKKAEFLWRCLLKKLRLKKEIDRLIDFGYHVTMWNLCGEPYYKVIVITKKEAL